MSPTQLQYLIPVLVLAGVATIVILRNAKPRRLRVELLWLRPLIILVAAGLLMFGGHLPQQLYAWPVLAAALLAGGGLGWLRARTIRIEVDAADHTATSQASPLGVMLIVAVIGARTLLRSAFASKGLGSPDALLATDALLVFAVGLICVSGLEVWVRATRMISQSKAVAGPA